MWHQCIGTIVMFDSQGRRQSLACDIVKLYDHDWHDEDCHCSLDDDKNWHRSAGYTTPIKNASHWAGGCGNQASFENEFGQEWKEMCLCGREHRGECQFLSDKEPYVHKVYDEYTREEDLAKNLERFLNERGRKNREEENRRRQEQKDIAEWRRLHPYGPLCNCWICRNGE